jgi:pimeloyl-ACP methyl ester carboxylesterase
MKEILKFFLVFISIGVFLFFSSVEASTVITTDIETDTVWTKENNPYILEDYIYINPGVTLRIEPGVIVKAKNSIIVRGRLEIAGTAQEPVYLTSFYNDEIGGDTNEDGTETFPSFESGQYFWEGIDASDTSVEQEVDISHAIIDYAYSGLYLGSGKNVNVTNTTFKNTYNAIYADRPGIVEISNSVFTENEVGIYIILDRNNPETSVFEVSDLSIYGNTYSGLQVTFPAVQVRKDTSSSIFARFWNLLKPNKVLAQEEEYSPYLLDFRDTWWGDVSGPFHGVRNPGGSGDKIIDDDLAEVLFEPWLLSDPNLPVLTTRDPVIIIPGITGSYLFKDYGNEGEIWPNLDALLVSPIDEFLNDLIMNPNGSEQPAFPIKVGDVIRKAGGQEIFSELLNLMINSGYVENSDLFVFPYDWRMSNSYNTLLLAEKIEDILEETNAEKVDIVAHSMGGILAKTYLVEAGEGKVDQLIFLGTPHLGAPKSYKALMYGDDLGYSVAFLGLNPSRAKIITQNMPAVYELLPSQKYINDNGGYVINQENENNPITLSYVETKNKMISDGRNISMFPFAENLHDEIDDLDLSGIEVHNFVGCGGKTLGEITFKRKLSWVGSSFVMADDFDIKYVNGDSTVPQVSAGAVESGETYFAKGISHGSMPSASGVKEAIVAILKGEEIPPHESILTTDQNCNISGKNVSVHSPVELHIYDADGNHAGPKSDGDIENEIPRVEYDVIGGEKFAFLPDGENYRIVTKATDTGGYDFVVKSQNENDEIVSTDEWKLIPLQTTEAEGEITIGPDHPREEYELAMDDDGDGVVDETIDPTPANGAFYYLDVLRSFIKSLDLKMKVEKALLEKIDKLEKKLKKKKDNKFVEKLEKIIERVEHNKGKFKKFSQSEKDSLLVTINSLLDSLK